MPEKSSGIGRYFSGASIEDALGDTKEKKKANDSHDVNVNDNDDANNDVSDKEPATARGIDDVLAKHKVEESPQKKVVGIYLPVALDEKLTDYAKSRKVSKSQVVEDLLVYMFTELETRER